MEFKPRRIKFKAWDEASRLLMRLNNIECYKGELVKRDHILLQFTGLHDCDGEEIYEMDVLMLSLEKFVVFWNEATNGWHIAPLADLTSSQAFLKDSAGKMKRFSSYYQLQAI
ncbi:MAG: hypothetical protein KIT62_08255 [Cyclobacteriaceae bacterium]|nr:hypothetical protein [Cyclobacteriaceae bacterium]